MKAILVSKPTNLTTRYRAKAEGVPAISRSMETLDTNNPALDIATQLCANYNWLQDGKFRLEEGCLPNGDAVFVFVKNKPQDHVSLKEVEAITAKNLIASHKTTIDNLERELVKNIQPLVESFCKKFELSFDTGMGQYGFYFNYPKGAREAPRTDEFFSQFDADLMKALSYKPDGLEELGISVEDFILPVESLVYIRESGEGLSIVELSDYDEDFELDSETDEEKFKFYDAYFYKVSRVLAEYILNLDSYIDMGLWR